MNIFCPLKPLTVRFALRLIKQNKYSSNKFHISGDDYELPSEGALYLFSKFNVNLILGLLVHICDNAELS